MASKDGYDIEAGQDRPPRYHADDDYSDNGSVKPATEQLTDENLGEDFESTQWLPPSIEVAMEFKRENIFRGGDAKIWKVQVTEAHDLGSGVSLYFHFAKSASICFFVMSIFAAPAMIFAFYGSKIPVEKRDAMGLYKFTVGNIGYNPVYPEYDMESSCNATRTFSGSNHGYNGTCIHVFNTEFKLPEVAGLLTFFEIIQILVFFCFIFHLQRVTNTIKIAREKELCSVSDYSIIVRKIPADTTKEQLISHFNALYPLDQKDWLGRPPLAGAKVTQNCENSNLPVHLGTWIAECTVHKAIGKYIKMFKDKGAILQKFYRCRAQMKMYADDTPHTGGGDLIKWHKAERNMEIIGSSIDMLTEKVVNSSNIILTNYENDTNIRTNQSTVEREVWNNGNPTSTSSTTNFGSPKNSPKNSISGNNSPKVVNNSNNNYDNSRIMDLNNHIKANTIAALITFEYAESMARAVEDFEHYSKFPRNIFFYPPKLKFRGYRLNVKKAPEPDEIVWENLEIPYYTKLFRRTRTSVLSFLLLIICFAVTLQASIYQGVASKALPYSTLCSTIIPQSYSPVQYNSVTIQRPQGKNRVTLDASCNSILPETFYGQYSVGTDYASPGIVGTYAVSACKTDAGGGICPVENTGTSTSYCPCVSTSSVTKCSSSECYNSPDTGCVSYAAGQIGACYCLATLQTLISAGGFKSVYALLSDTRDVCRTFTINYLTAEGLIYAIVVFSTLLNMFLKWALITLTRLESHSQVDKEQGSLLLKFFFAAYLNMAFTALIAYGYLPKLPQILQEVYFFQGLFPDLTPEWYAAAGVYFMTAFIVQTVVPLGTQLLPYFIFMPLSRKMNYPAVRGQSSHSIVMQAELNMMQVGPPFDSTIQTSQLLSLVFFAMTYAPGLPLLMPMACVTCLLFFVIDKCLLLRYYQKPPHISEHSIKIVLFTLPYAALIRLGLGIWMIGNTVVFPPINGQDIIKFAISIPNIPFTNIGSVQYLAYLERFKYAYGGMDSSFAFLEEKVFQPHTFPLFCLFLLIIVVKLIILSFKQFSPHQYILPFVYFCWEKIFFCIKYKKVASVDDNGNLLGFKLMELDNDLRQESAPYTGEYYKYLQSKIGGADDDEPLLHKLDYCNCFHGNLDDLTAQEMDDGWEQVEQGDYIIKVKKFNNAVNIGGVVRSVGERKRTYEVIQDDGINSYLLDKIPAYRAAVQGLKAGINSLMEDNLGGMTAFYQKKKDAKKNKSDVNWNRHVVPDSVLRKKYTEEQKTADAYDRFKSAGVKPLENHDDDDDEVENDEDDEDNRSQESSVVSSESDEELLVNKPKQKPRVSTTNRERERDREGEDEGDSYREREREGDRAPQHPRKLPPLEADSGKSYR